MYAPLPVLRLIAPTYTVWTHGRYNRDREREIGREGGREGGREREREIGRENENDR